MENCIEWLRGQEQATVTLSQRSMITKIRKLAERKPGECQIVAENQDGSVVAHVPAKWVKIAPPKAISQENRSRASMRMKKYHSNHIANIENL